MMPELNRIYQGDCLEIMRGWPDACVDVVITDPPYNVGIEYGIINDKKDDYGDWCREWFTECRRIARFGVGLTPGIVNVAMWTAIEKPRWIVCWHKPAAMGRSPFGFNNWEPVIYWGKPANRGLCDVVVAPILPDSDLSGHPCPKPLMWGKKLIELFTKEGMTVCDPFMGSGTIALAAEQQKREWVGAEINHDYIAIAENRIASEKSQIKMF